ncbi:MAG TPA: hypothetical protein VMG12_19705 [Polyangiaceae bacterium]|nr:hypothetical protein [Polyangiaceae bacterium]
MPRPAVSLAAALALSTISSTLGCETRGEPPACLDQRQEARNLALRGDIEPAQRLLDQVKQSCGPNSQSDIQHITKLIAEKTAAREKQRQLEQGKSDELQKFPSRSFVEWATARAGDIGGKLAAPRCAERGTPDYGFCDGERPDVPSMRLRYWQAQPEAYRYSLVSELAPSCQDLGEYRQVRVWSRDGSDYELCELTNRRLRHLTALIVHGAAGYEMHLFSQSYPSFDPAFERRLRVIPQ